MSSEPKNSGVSKPRETGKSKPSKFFSISKTVLAILWQTGELTVKAFFPHPYSHVFCNHKDRRGIYNSLRRLENKKFISRFKKNNETIFRLTAKGEKEAFFEHLDAKLALYKPKRSKWDGFWRIIFFDIPEKKRRYRDYLRDVLKILGFKELQKSIWITPHKIPNFLQDLLWEERIKHFTRFITVKHIDYDKDLRKHFKLKKIAPNDFGIP